MTSPAERARDRMGWSGTSLIHSPVEAVWLESRLEPVFGPKTGSSRDSNQTAFTGSCIRGRRVVRYAAGRAARNTRRRLAVPKLNQIIALTAGKKGHAHKII